MNLCNNFQFGEKMDQEIKKTKKNFFTSLDRATTIHLLGVVAVIFAYVLFLIVQQYFFSSEDMRSKLIIINVLLIAGIVMEIVSFIWIMYKKKKKEEKKLRKTETLAKDEG